MNNSGPFSPTRYCSPYATGPPPALGSGSDSIPKIFKKPYILSLSAPSTPDAFTNYAIA